MEFVHQLRLDFKGKKLVIILDNVSYHRGKYIREKLKTFPEVIIKFLPTYSPEYNPVEQIWRWLKPLVYGSQAVVKGVKEIISRLRRICWHWRMGKLPHPLNVGLGIWDDLVINIYDT